MLPVTLGPLELTLAPLLEGTELLCVRLDTPLGMLLEEETPAIFSPFGRSAGSGSATSPGPPPQEAAAGQTDALSRPAPTRVVVAEVFTGSSAELGGVHVGDVVRASTFMSMAMSYPACVATS